jgi:hypothetical protein
MEVVRAFELALEVALSNHQAKTNIASQSKRDWRNHQTETLSAF